jgi:hypothetical protein
MNSKSGIIWGSFIKEFVPAVIQIAQANAILPKLFAARSLFVGQAKPAHACHKFNVTPTPRK